MPIKKLDDGRYMVDIRPLGRKGNRIRRTFNKKAEAVAFERYTMANAKRAGTKSDRRHLSQFLELWWLYYGQTIEHGAVEFTQLKKTVRELGDPAINRLNKQVLLEHRGKRLLDGIKASTINREMYRLSGVLSVLKKLEIYNGENPINGLPFLKITPPEMTFLSHDEITYLLSSLSGDYRKIALLCLSTGARYGEASKLRSEQVNNGRVTFLKTKNGKLRVVPISPDLEQEIKTKPSGQLFKVSYDMFREKLKKIKPDLPRGQATHVLRHTFASHFMMNGGNIVALQQILGHANIQQTMTYAHLAPDYLQLAVILNPLKGGIGN